MAHETSNLAITCCTPSLTSDYLVVVGTQDGMLGVIGEDPVVKQNQLRLFKKYKDQKGALTAVVPTRGGQLITGGADGVIRVYDEKKGCCSLF